jgi:hypothetical protein
VNQFDFLPLLTFRGAPITAYFGLRFDAPEK